MKNKNVFKSRKWNKGKRYSKNKNYSFDNPRDKKEIDKFAYQEYLRNQNVNIENVDYKHLEDVFTNEIHYKAMKELPIIEKQAIYVAVFEADDLENACSIMKMSKTEVIEIKTQAINRFKENVKKQMKAKKNGGDSNE